MLIHYSIYIFVIENGSIRRSSEYLLGIYLNEQCSKIYKPKFSHFVHVKIIDSGERYIVFDIFLKNCSRKRLHLKFCIIGLTSFNFLFVQIGIINVCIFIFFFRNNIYRWLPFWWRYTTKISTWPLGNLKETLKNLMFHIYVNLLEFLFPNCTAHSCR